MKEKNELLNCQEIILQFETAFFVIVDDLFFTEISGVVQRGQDDIMFTRPIHLEIVTTTISNS